ncbi:restriction endonuclease subunit S [Erysipelothrix rhusiopathiae]|uniref:restriction endonuclease subunit S n=1 Tax=Erysipelothrix rhusiopathiae TaxID=1648 RepID=UPI002B25532B|nr:restriction endonuclease subunit S [Erysipelothrix rhusiopathiae]WRB92554.1 restriction endonuclease subunit S [Erysipelothrix rhusiopathiae]
MMKNKPDIRFDGFTDAWEQRRLGELAESFEYGLNASSKEYDGKNKYLRITDIDDNSRQFRTESLTSPNINLDLAKNYILKNGDILFARTGPSVGKTYKYNEIDGLVYYAGFLIRTRIKKDVNAEFIFQNTLTDNYQNYIKVTSQRSGQPGVNAHEYAKFEIMVPKQSEQNQIGTFFQNLDSLITLHQRELENYKLLKKGFLQKLFPSNGDTNPSIRFDGFNDAWEQCNLGEVSDKVTKKNSKNEFIETFTNSAEHGIINQRDFFDKDISNEKNLNGYYVVNENDFVYNPRISNFAPVGPIKRNKLGRTGVMSPLYYVFKTKNVNKTYLEYYFDTTIWHKFMKLNGDSGARFDRFAIKDSVFKEMPIPYPSEGEQHQIGIFFQSLDNLITLHQRELDNYKELKKGFLQKMFV